MLRAVGNPVAVNPDAELARIAAEEGWRVMRFEKLGRRLAIGAAARPWSPPLVRRHPPATDARALAPARPSRGACAGSTSRS